MTSRSRSVAKAFGKQGVLAKATSGLSVGGVAPVANEAALGTGDVGDLKIATATKSAFLYDGTEWDRIQTGGNAAPFFKKSPTALTMGGLDSETVSVLAGDPEGFPVTYSWDALKVDSSNTVHYKEGGGTFPPGITNVVHANESSGDFTFQADSTGSGLLGDYTYRIIASDGGATTVSTASLSVAYGNLFHTKYKAAVEAAGGTCTVHNLNATDHANLHTYIDASVGTIADGRYDVLLLAPGTYTITSETNANSYDPFMGKSFAFVGNTDKPHKVIINHGGTTGRDLPIYGDGDNSLGVGFRATKAIANCTWKRQAGSATNYIAAMRRNMGGLARNVLFDFGGYGQAMNYYNSEPGTPTHRLTTFACTFANIGTRLASYSGDDDGHYNSRALAAATTTWDKYTWTNNSGTGTLTSDGTKIWTYADNGATRGHLYKTGNTDYTIDISGVGKGFSDADTG